MRLDRSLLWGLYLHTITIDVLQMHVRSLRIIAMHVISALLSDRTFHSLLACLVLQVIGTPTPEQVAHLDADTRDYILTHRPQTNAVDLPAKYPGATIDDLDLLRSMLSFSADDRIGVDSALAHPYVTCEV